MNRGDVAVSVVAALAAATSFALASALQHGESRSVAARGALDPGLLGSLLQRPLWLLGTAADVVAVALQAVALRYGPVSLVQPLLVAGLPIAVVLSCLLQRRRPARGEVLGVVLCGVGLCLVAPVVTSVGLAPQPRRSLAAMAGVTLAVVVMLLLLLSRRRPRLAGVTTGAAAGIVLGTGSVLLAVCASRFGDLGRLFTSLAPYVTVAVGLLGLLLSQAAFQTGGISAPLATLSIVEPVVAVLLAVTLLHESLPQSPAALASGLAGTAVAVAGVAVLARLQAAHAPAATARA